MSITRTNDVQRAVYIVRAPQLPYDEVFDNSHAAGVFASMIPASSITELPLHSSLNQADVITERKVIVDAGRVLADSTITTWSFRDRDAELPISDADVESFHCSRGHWHILGFGTDSPAVLDQTQCAVDAALARRDNEDSDLPSRHDTCLHVGAGAGS